MNSLLPPNEVARLLHLSVRTVYAQSHRLGGFYPAGIRALRFRREDIYAIMEGPQKRQLEVPVSTSGPTATPRTGPEPSPGPEVPRSPTARAWPISDPSVLADSVRFGLRDPD